MNNDRHHDEQVSATYQDLAKERTPEHLDRAVLHMATANAGRPQYLRWIAWSRPLAWAATVALCLAITLEVTQVTAPDNLATESIPAEVAAPAAALAPELHKDKQEQDSEQFMEQQTQLTESMSDAISSEKISPARSAAKQTVNEPAPAGRRREDRSFSAGYAASGALAADMPSDECAEENRAEPESWLECIDALEASGDVEAALRQREKLIEVFPDFKLP